MTGATVSWSTADNGVASVDATGKVTARANGSARIIATSSSVADTAIVTVAQRAVTLNVTPVRDTIDAGEFVQLSASAVDANGHAVAGANLTWTSSDTTIATVSTTGRVVGKFRGQVSITVRSGTIQGTATINVNIADFRPTTNTTISGSPVYGRLEIPAGVTVTVTSALNARVLDSLRISGTLRGDCVDIRLTVEGPMRVGGTIDNQCSNPQGTAKVLHLINDDAMQFDSTATVRGGSIAVTNNSAVAARLRGGPVRGPFMFVVSPAPCNFGGAWETESGHDGQNGSPDGRDGSPGLPSGFDCTGDFVFSGSIDTGHGGRGGEGTATATQGGAGGRGGDGGDIKLTSLTRMTFKKAVMFSGAGGEGGHARGGPDTKPEATGGTGGTPGRITVIAPAIDIQGLFMAMPFDNSRGGDAVVTAPNGADATATTPAQPGVVGAAKGGSAGQFPANVLLIGDVFVGAVVGASTVTMSVHHTATSVQGGDARVTGGKGGNGSRQHKDGGAGPAHVASGGFGMNVRVMDNRSGALVPVGVPGDGGKALVLQTFGGSGWSDCVAGSIESGGIGGPGGVLEMSGGAPGTAPGGLMGKTGDVGIFNASNGGSGGDGEQRGTGGAGGSANVLVGVPTFTNSFEPGTPGRPCNYTATAKATVANDPSGHDPFLLISQIAQGAVRLALNNVINLTFGIPMTGTITPGPNGTFTFTANGSGTINGRTATGTFTSGAVTVDANGRLATVTGVFTFGTNGALPTGAPVSYNVTFTAPVQTP